MFLAGQDRVHGITTEAAGPLSRSCELTIKITAGMKGKLPRVGDNVCFSILTTGSGPWLRLPKDVPWTHQPRSEARQGEIDEQGATEWERADA
jgi:hypothetical protein